MTRLKNKRTIPRQLGTVLIILVVAALMTGCSSVKTVQFKINSEPEGSHVVLQVTNTDALGSGDWIYLGHTPIRGVRQLDQDATENAKITLKVMHAGYHDQIREWDGKSFWEETLERGFIFWTPELIPQPHVN